MDLIDKLHEASFLFVTREQFAQMLEGCSVEPVEEDGRLIGAHVVDGPEYHYYKFDSTPVRKHHISRLACVISQYGYASTKTPISDERQCRFNRLIGFVETGRDEQFVYQRIDRLRKGI